MNPQRYIMPVVIAAGLHSALVFFYPDREPVIRAKPEKPRILPDIDILRIDMTPDEDPATAAGDSGGASELPPSIPDTPRELLAEDIFRIDVRERVDTPVPITNLPRIPEGIGGLGKTDGLGNGARGIISSINLDRAPRATVQPPPAYPAAMRTSGTSGSVTVEFIVDMAGRVVTAEAVKWTHREFVDPAVRAVMRWHFEPGTVEGRKVKFRMAVPIEFNAER